MQLHKRLLGFSGVCLMTSPDLARVVGRTEAIFLQQLHYWLTSDKSHGFFYENKRWVYNTYQDWQEQIKIVSTSTIRRVVKKLEEKDIILCSKLAKKKSDQTKSYTINYEALFSLIPSLKENKRLSKMNSPTVQNEQFYNKEAETTSEINLLSEEKPVVEDTPSQQVHVVQEDILSISQNSNTNPPPEPSDLPASSPTTTSSPNTLASDLLEIWNQTVGQRQGEEGNLIQLTKKRAQYLVAAFKFRFESNLSKWKQFCQQVTSSAFLMGKAKSTFRASLDWVLKFDIIQRILEGDFGVNKTPCVDEETVLLKTEAITQTIETSSEGEPIKRLRRSILQALGEQTYQSWFADMPMIHMPTTKGGRCIQLHTKSLFACDYVQTNYLDKLTSLTDCELVVVLESSNNHHTGGGNGLVLDQGLQ
jgi:DnaA N-terminal domain